MLAWVIAGVGLAAQAQSPPARPRLRRLPPALPLPRRPARPTSSGRCGARHAPPARAGRRYTRLPEREQNCVLRG
ncbi:MAG: hypothetical protein WKG07_39830 [Hymenobacter sp.]